jgi:hypothetical protein
MSRMPGFFSALAIAIICAPFATAGATPDSGLLITQYSGTKWQAQLIAGPNTPQTFTGTFSSSLGVTSLYRYKLESTDSAEITADGSLAISFDATVNSFDAVQFWTPRTAQICVRNTGGSPVKVYVGATLAEAVEVSLPLNLAGEDPCGIKPPPGPYQTTRKYHPGHYTALLRSQGALKYMQETVQPGSVGLMKRYSWRKLEPTQGNYDFAGIAADLNWAQSYGRQLIIMIEDKTFSAENPAPDYLASFAKPNVAGGYTVVRWDPTVVARWKALVKAMGARFDAHPNFEGIATQETSLSFNSTTLQNLGYSPEKYRDAYIDGLSSALVSLPTSRVFWYANFFVGNQSYIGSIAKVVGPKGVVLAGPDVMPDNNALVTRFYPYYGQFKGLMHLGIQAEGICYRHPHATPAATQYWTPAELFTYARDTLHVDYMIWVRVPVANPVGSYSWYDALPVMQANPVLGTR